MVRGRFSIAAFIKEHTLKIHGKNLVMPLPLAYPRTMKNGTIFLLASVLALSACSTMQGLKHDLSSGYNAVSNQFAKWVDPEKEAKMKLPVYDGTCPGVSVRPDLKRLVEFTDDTKPSDSSKISEVEILHVQNTCRVGQDALTMQIDITLAGKTGPKARVKSSDQPSFAYPYFIAVTDDTGTILSKEIFAATIAYGKDKNELTQTENIFQNMPFPNKEDGRVYNVVVGFQLTDAQLAYNQANPSSKPVTTSGGGATTPSGAPVSLVPPSGN
jgi:predicted small secreted protein